MVLVKVTLAPHFAGLLETFVNVLKILSISVTTNTNDGA